MKRIIIAVSLLIGAAAGINAQTEFDALRFIQPDIYGSARYTSMAGAFGALGGDPSAIQDNPAGLGIFRSSDFSIGFNSTQQSSTSRWHGETTTDGMSRVGFNNLSFVLSTIPLAKTQRDWDLFRSNWAFSYNRLKQFDRNVTINGKSGAASSITDYMAYFTGNISGDDLYETDFYKPFNNTSVPWISVLAANAGLMVEYVDSETNETVYWESLLNPGETVTPAYSLSEQGYSDEYSFSWSGNFSNRLFVGATVNVHDTYYRADTEYFEAFENGGDMTLYNVLKTTATGFSARIGAIYIPVDFLRVGASIKTPSIYKITDLNYSDLNYYYDATSNGTIYSPTGESNYKMRNPMVYNISASLILGTRAVIGVEYVTSQNYNTQLMTLGNETSDYRYENDSINALFNEQNMLKIGAELKLTKRLALRGGYAIAGPATHSRLAKEMIPTTLRTDVEYFIHNQTKFYTAGIGYRKNNWYFDLAYMNKVVDETFYAYNTNKLSSNLKVEPASVLTDKISYVFTVGLRF